MRVPLPIGFTGARATAERPLGWVMMEPDRALAQQVVRVRTWPTGAPPKIIATTHSHAAWVKAGEPEIGREVIALPESAKVEI